MTPVTLSDVQLRELLAPPAETVAPSGLLLDISDAVRHHPQVRPGLRWPWSRDLGNPLGVAPSRRLAWALIVIGMVAVLAAGAMIGTRIIWRLPSDRPPTGIETLTHGLGSYEQVIRDGRGQLWAFGTGHLARFELDVGPDRQWSISDDLTFQAHVAAGALDGGVWLAHRDEIRRFDGTTFRETVPAPPTDGGLSALVELPGGVLIAATFDVVGWRWDGTAWSRPAEGSPRVDWPVLMVDADDVWASEWQDDRASYRGLWHLSGSQWTSYGVDDLPLLRECCMSLAGSPDGSVWAASGRRVARFTDGQWTDVGDPGFDTVALGWDGEGSMLAMSLDPDVGARLVGDRWVPFDAAPGPPIGEVISLMSDRVGVFLGATSGLYHLADGGWKAAWPGVADGPVSRTVAYAHFGHQILATGPDETWVAGNDGQLWHYIDGRWERPASPPGTHIRAIRELADGSLALATDAGVVVQAGDTWDVAVSDDTWDVAVSDDGSLWAATDPGIVRHLVRDGDGWNAVAIGPCPANARSVAVDRDGAVWLGGITYSGTGGIARLDAAGCHRLEPLGDPAWVEVMDIEAHPDGGVVIVIGRAVPQRVTSEAEPKWDWAMVRYDGTAWTTLLTVKPDVGWFGDLSIGPDGTVWMGRDGLRRYRDGNWELLTGAITAPAISVAPDGSVFFLGPSGLQRIRAEALPD